MKSYTQRANYTTLQSPSPIEKVTQLRLMVSASLKSMAHIAWRSLIRENEQFKVWQSNENGEMQWNALDARTGNTIYNVSEDTIREWIDRQLSPRSLRSEQNRTPD